MWIEMWNCYLSETHRIFFRTQEAQNYDLIANLWLSISINWILRKSRKIKMPSVRLELTTFRLWDWRANQLRQEGWWRWSLTIFILWTKMKISEFSYSKYLTGKTWWWQKYGVTVPGTASQKSGMTVPNTAYSTVTAKIPRFSNTAAIFWGDSK